MGYITLNKKHFFHNLDAISQQTNAKEKIAIVLKDNAYGHGLIEMATLSQEYGVAHAVVRTGAEASTIASNFKTILVLADIHTQPTHKHIHIAINDIADLSLLKEDTAIELKFDTGMHRHGLTIENIQDAFAIIHTKKLRLKGVFTHHRSADVLSSEYFWQEEQFSYIKQQIEEALKKYNMPPLRYHSQNSAATFRTNTPHDIVRVGVAAYWLLTMPQALLQADLKPVLSLWAQRLHSFESQKHFKHGYEGKGLIKEDSTLSTYDIGYADGLLRLPDDQAYLSASGDKFIGRVSMDNVIIQSDKDKLCLFHDANDYAKTAQTISYEVVVRLAPSLPRSII